MKRTFLILAMSLATVFAGAKGKGQPAVSQEQMLDRFLSYVRIDSQSTPALSADEFPMTEGQREMAAFIADEIRGFAPGIDCRVSEDCYVYVNIPSNVRGKELPVLGFSCHLDVTPECKSAPVKPSVIRNYQGGDIRLNDSTWLKMDSPQGADLKSCIGKTIIHTDGSTLLGGDDKCGCSVVVSLIESTVRDKSLKHGPLQFVICPNEDVGLSAARIDTTLFNPEILFDIDAAGIGNITRSNFTASQIIVKFIGHDAHPGDAKALKYGDALAAASNYIASFPLETRPERSSGLEGYIHPWSMTADGNNNYTVSVRIRYFDRQEGEKFRTYLDEALASTRTAYPNVGTEILDNSIQYENVAYTMHPASFDIVSRASEATGIPVRFIDERGGTTAAMFCARGMNGGMCIFSGQHAIHSVYEYAVLEEMYGSYCFALELIRGTAALK